MALVLLVSTINLTSCGKKHCHKPEGPKPKPECQHQPAEVSETVEE
ncbi:MAG: hypothetical protein K0S53_906 [Bacteroidetes bacterium]|nr:hypothetical protein [Bacteroidota bacterium]